MRGRGVTVLGLPIAGFLLLLGSGTSATAATGRSPRRRGTGAAALKREEEPQLPLPKRLQRSGASAGRTTTPSRALLLRVGLSSSELCTNFPVHLWRLDHPAERSREPRELGA